ncbi:hypothetical protein AAU61_20835 [Desulfocarbo indianensis]|nr:hypothetical protein AAU61_20835 [Desulfocarbo indianensis]
MEWQVKPRKRLSWSGHAFGCFHLQITRAHQLVDLGARQELFKERGPLRNGILRLFVTKVFDTTFEDAMGYPSTDRTFGVGLSFAL